MDPLKRIAKEDGRLHVAGTPEGFDALVVADAARARGGITCFVATDHGRATSFLDSVAFFAPDLEVLRFPNWDCLPYDRMGPSPAVAAERMAALTVVTTSTGRRSSRGRWARRVSAAIRSADTEDVGLSRS